MAVSALTHHEDIAQQGCALWCLMIRHAVLHGELPDGRRRARASMPTRRTTGRSVLAEAETHEPRDVRPERLGRRRAAGRVVGDHAHAGAGDVPCRHLPDALATAIAIGHDTDTVAAIAGALLGARWGASAVPAEWRRHRCTAGPVAGPRSWSSWRRSPSTAGRPDRGGWPACERMDYATGRRARHLRAAPARRRRLDRRRLRARRAARRTSTRSSACAGTGAGRCRPVWSTYAVRLHRHRRRGQPEPRLRHRRRRADGAAAAGRGRSRLAALRGGTQPDADRGRAGRRAGGRSVARRRCAASFGSTAERAAAAVSGPGAAAPRSRD